MSCNICPSFFKEQFFGDLFNCNNKDKGYLNVVWAGDPITIPNDSVVFTICFDVIGDAGNKSPIIFNGNFISGGVEVCYKDVSPCSKSILKFNQGQIDLVSSDFKLFRSYCDADGAKKVQLLFMVQVVLLHILILSMAQNLLVEVSQMAKGSLSQTWMQVKILK